MGRFISEDTIKGLIEYPVTINSYNYCCNNPYFYVDKDGLWIQVAVGFVAGGAALAGTGNLVAAGAAKSAATTLTTEFLEKKSGESEKSWAEIGIDTFGSTVGGAVGSAVEIPIVGDALEEGTKTIITEGGKKLTGISDDSWEKIILNTGLDMSSGAISGALGEGLGKIIDIKIPGINSGRGSWQAVSRQLFTKLKKGKINEVSFKSFLKMVTDTAFFEDEKLKLKFGGSFIDLLQESIEDITGMGINEYMSSRLANSIE